LEKPSLVLLLAFLLLYSLAFLTTRSLSQRDPTSYFFDPAKGYKRVYSLFRQEQAEEFTRQVSQGAHVAKWDPEQIEETLCVGVATVARHETRYFRAAVGSLLEGLTAQERARIYLILFIAHTDPTLHPAFSETWLHSVADEVLLYNKSLPAAQINRLRELERANKRFNDKPLFDYGYLIKGCLSSPASHMALFEDDIIAIDGWFHRTENALEEMKNRIKQDQVADGKFL
jgi:hypothetical protein